MPFFNWTLAGAYTHNHTYVAARRCFLSSLLKSLCEFNWFVVSLNCFFLSFCSVRSSVLIVTTNIIINQLIELTHIWKIVLPIKVARAVFRRILAFRLNYSIKRFDLLEMGSDGWLKDQNCSGILAGFADIWLFSIKNRIFCSYHRFIRYSFGFIETNLVRFYKCSAKQVLCYGIISEKFTKKNNPSVLIVRA